ncbi:hypothetical protein T439DRAFT_172815 [Meredithblackwellia eburnea MCA 4105]
MSDNTAVTRAEVPAYGDVMIDPSLLKEPRVNKTKALCPAIQNNMTKLTGRHICSDEREFSTIVIFDNEGNIKELSELLRHVFYHLIEVPKKDELSDDNTKKIIGHAFHLELMSIDVNERRKSFIKRMLEFNLTRYESIAKKKKNNKPSVSISSEIRGLWRATVADFLTDRLPKEVQHAWFKISSGKLDGPDPRQAYDSVRVNIQPKDSLLKIVRCLV